MDELAIPEGPPELVEGHVPAIPEVTLEVAEELVPLVTARLRHRMVAGRLHVSGDGESTLVHVVESVGIPRTEIGRLLIGGVPVEPSRVPVRTQTVAVLPVTRPQRGHRYLLDVHLGALARRMRMLGLDTAYRNDATDAELVSEATASDRVLLTQDRGLLRRRALPHGAYVRGSRADDQLGDVLDRFDPALHPWTRCPACNGVLRAVPKAQVAHQLQPGTLATYDEFSCCGECGRAYWRGAHASALEAMVRRATLAQSDQGAR